MRKIKPYWLSMRLKALHRDQKGADMVEYILIIAAVALPILAIVLYFRDDIYDWIKVQWEDIKGESVPDQM